MKPLFVVFISLTGAIAAHSTMLAQTTSAQTANPTSAPEVHTQSGLLSTQPASLNRSANTSSKQAPALNTAILKNIANSIHTHPQADSGTGALPSHLIPKDLLRTPPKPISDTNPLQPFQVPPPNPSFGINLNNF